MKRKFDKEQFFIKLLLMGYDTVIFSFVVFFVLVVHRGGVDLDVKGTLLQTLFLFLFLTVFRLEGKVYRQVWRYGDIPGLLRIVAVDTIACFIYWPFQMLVLTEHSLVVSRVIQFFSMNTLGAIVLRMVYRYAYKSRRSDSLSGKFCRLIMKVFSLGRVSPHVSTDDGKIKIAIIGAGSMGQALAEELRENPKSELLPMYFIDNDHAKIGRTINSLKIIDDSDESLAYVQKNGVEEVVFTIHKMEISKKRALYERYIQAGFRVKVYDYPIMMRAGARRYVREFDIEDLLCRKPINMLEGSTPAYYKDKVILITGGGGSIGTELCRQVARMQPKQVILVDIYENSAYDVQQGMMFAYKGKIDFRVEIVSITNKVGMARVFAEYHPQIVINAAAHKHVPLMEKNCIEAVENNVFGTLNVVQLCEEYGTERFMMVSTDKAVNPTNVMGATKRMCELIVMCYSSFGKVKYSATRFGNVLGSAGSVIPLFKRQIGAGGPVTVTDKRIIRYFMTIPEASQLVLTSGAMANNGELFVLDMGKPVKIYDLAQNMIRLSGIEDVEIIETGLRPGEKLYEELLVKTDELTKTENELIFIEKDDPITLEELNEKLNALRGACNMNDDEVVKKVLHEVIPTFKTPEEVNSKAANR